MSRHQRNSKRGAAGAPRAPSMPAPAAYSLFSHVDRWCRPRRRRWWRRRGRSRSGRMLETMPLPDLPAYRTSILYTAAQRPSCRHASRATLATPRRTLGIATARIRIRRGSTAPGGRGRGRRVRRGIGCTVDDAALTRARLGPPLWPGHARVLLAQAEVAPAQLPLRPPHIATCPIHSGRGAQPSDGARLSLCWSRCTVISKKIRFSSSLAVARL